MKRTRFKGRIKFRTSKVMESRFKRIAALRGKTEAELGREAIGEWLPNEEVRLSLVTRNGKEAEVAA